jgi:cellulose biosynthesis protein BcsQ
MLYVVVDRTAGERLALQRRLEEALIECRKSVGHLANLEFIPASPEELPVYSDRKDVAVVFGPALGVDEIISRSHGLSLPTFALLTTESLSLRNLRRLEKANVTVLETEDPASRIIHALLRALSEHSRRGKLVTVNGVKGGVGASSLVAGLAHAAQMEDHTAIVVDLSKRGVLLQYLGAPRWHSPEYRIMLTEQLAPTVDQIKKGIVSAPNGIEALLPPSGGVGELRDLWLRSPDSLELNLALFDILLELYDVVIIDIAGADGVLPFALENRADERVLVGSNDPASVHLLGGALKDACDYPAAGQLTLALTLLAESALSEREIIDLLITEEQRLVKTHIIPKDRGAAQWIGTGNSIYTEGSRKLQENLRSLYCTLAGKRPNEAERSRLRQFLEEKILKRERRTLVQVPALPAPQIDQPFVLEEDIRADYEPPIKVEAGLWRKVG